MPATAVHFCLRNTDVEGAILVLGSFRVALEARDLPLAGQVTLAAWRGNVYGILLTCHERVNAMLRTYPGVEVVRPASVVHAFRENGWLDVPRRLRDLPTEALR